MYTENDYNEADKNPNDQSSFTCIELYARFKGWQACTIHQALKDFSELDADKQNEFCEILIQMMFHISDLFHMEDFIKLKQAKS